MFAKTSISRSPQNTMERWKSVYWQFIAKLNFGLLLIDRTASNKAVKCCSWFPLSSAFSFSLQMQSVHLHAAGKWREHNAPTCHTMQHWGLQAVQFRLFFLAYTSKIHHCQHQREKGGEWTTSSAQTKPLFHKCAHAQFSLCHQMKPYHFMKTSRAGCCLFWYKSMPRSWLKMWLGKYL